MNITSSITILALVVSLCADTVYAQAPENEFSYELRTGFGYSDNITRLPANEIDETIAVVGVEFSFQRESRGFEAVVDADIEYRDYQDGTFSGETFGSLNADIQFNVIQDVASWVISDRFGQTQGDPFAPQSPQNRETVNTFSTGPDLRIALGSASAIEVAGRFGINTFQETDVDNDTLGGRLSFIRALSRSRQLSLNVTTDRIEFDNTTFNSNFDRQAVYIGFSHSTSRSNLTLNVGYNELHDFGRVQDGSVFELSFDRDLTSSIGFSFGYDQRLTDASGIFRDFQTLGAGFGATRNVSAVGDPLEISSARLQFNFDRRAMTYTLTLVAQEDDFVSANNLDRRRVNVLLGGRWSIGERWNVSLDAGLARTDFDALARDDEDLTVRGGLNVRLSRTLGLNLDVLYFDRDSSNDFSDYVENQAFLTLRYSP